VIWLIFLSISPNQTKFLPSVCLVPAELFCHSCLRGSVSTHYTQCGGGGQRGRMLATSDTTSRQTWQNVNSNQPGSRSKTLSYDHNWLAFLLPVLHTHRAMHISRSSCHLSAACGALAPLTSLYDILYKSNSPVYCSSVNLCKC
jgi:hypothetical protein